MKQNLLDSLPDSALYERDPEALTEEEADEWEKRVTKAREKLKLIDEAINKKPEAKL